MTAKSDQYAIIWLLSDVSRLIGKLVDRRLGNIGFTRSQWQVLGNLRRTDSLSQAALAELTEVEAASCSVLIDRLEGAGWITRRSHPRDRRINLVSMTEKAAGVMDEAAAIGQRMRENMMVDVSQSEREQLVATLSTIKFRLCLLLETKSGA
jgi:DNA-binding MarR family transcriptional regulator